MNEKNQNLNKGFSLVEILVALAVGSIVMVIVSMLVIVSVTNYRQETAKASTQNEANIAMNQIADNLMEADCFTVTENPADSTVEYIVKSTQEKVVDATGVETIVTKETKYKYDAGKGRIYYGNNAVLCDNVKNFKIYVLSSSLKKNDKNEYVDVNNPFRVMVSLTVNRMNVDRAITREISLRNNIDTVTLPGGVISKSQNKQAGANLVDAYVKKVADVSKEETTTSNESESGTP